MEYKRFVVHYWLKDDKGRISVLKRQFKVFSQAVHFVDTYINDDRFMLDRIVGWW